MVLKYLVISNPKKTFLKKEKDRKKLKRKKLKTKLNFATFFWKPRTIKKNLDWIKKTQIVDEGRKYDYGQRVKM